MKRTTMIFVSGSVWLCMGTVLLYKGVGLLSRAVVLEYNVHTLSTDAGRRVLLWLVIALFVGLLKGRMVFAKVVRRVVQRIVQVAEPVKIRDVYALKHLYLLLGMMGLGIALRYSFISTELRGCVNIAIGFALVQGGFQYFRSALQLKLMT